jgi:hypothetical protein
VDAARKKALMIVVAVASVVEVAYVTCANLFLRSQYFDSLINSEPEKLLIRFESPVSLWPGHLRLKKFEIKGHDGSVKWTVKSDSIAAQITLIPLIWRTLDVRSAEISHTSIQIELWQKRLPKKVNLEPIRRPFRLVFHDLDLNKIEEIKIHKYRFRGLANLDGAFTLLPGQEVNVTKAEFDFLEGNVTSHDLTVLKDFKGTLTANLLDYLPPEDKDLDVLDHLGHVSLDIRGTLNDPNFINLYLLEIPWIRIATLNGALKAKVEVRDGVIVEGTEGEVKADHVDLQLGPYHSESWGRVRWGLNKDILKMNLSIHDYKFLGLDLKKPFMNGKSLKVLANTKNLRLKDMFSKVNDLAVELGIKQAKITDLDFLNDFIPVTDKFTIDDGEADLDAKIYLSTRSKSKKGFIKLHTNNATTTFRDLKFKANAEFSCNIQDTEENIDTFEVTDAKLTLSQVSVLDPKTSGQRKVKNWGGTFIIPEVLLQPNHSVIVSGNFGMEYDNAEPILLLLGSEFRVVKVFQAFAAVDKLSGNGHFKIGPGLLEFSSVKLNASDVELLGRYRFYENLHKFVTWFRFETFKAGIEYDGKRTNFSVTNALDWYEKREEWPPIRAIKITPPAL